MDREVTDRRRSHRWPAGAVRWTGVRLRPGREAVLINLCDRGALVEGSARLHPGASVVLQLTGPARSTPIHGTVVRCQVWCLGGGAGVRYRGAIRFDRTIEVEIVPESRGSADPSQTSPM
jgi:hypothetical protein